MITGKQAAAAAGACAGAGLGITFAALYYRAMHPEIPKPVQGRRHIACVGDSLTYGCGLLGAFRTYAYPAVLQELLGPEYQVMNFGICDRTLSDDGDKPYRREKIYAASLSSEPETVLIMLGTNDAKPGNWDAEKYEKDLWSYVSVYANLPARPDIVLMQPPKAFGVLGKTLDGIRDEVIRGEMHGIIARAGRENGCKVIDLYSLTENHREWFTDGIHLNREGTAAVAQLLYRTVSRKD